MVKKRRKPISLATLKRELKALRSEGQRCVFTNGCFDILHAGHVRYLTKARTLGDALIVGLNSDKSVRKIKGKSRPIVPEEERAEVLLGLEAVDFVVLFDTPTPIGLIEALLPDVLAKGADWIESDIVGAEAVKRNGGRVARVKLVKGKSTTNIIKRIEKLKK
ncbi:MAG: D-glycero-beta-D-manno-heptose 1-phosphate adenylyltransferase [Proteobacteria bacterium]|nr:D-glycero-beta-D-manno-heptose 1-phosphate adenylyltransferase [Pseudomonadota bacterium]